MSERETAWRKNEKYTPLPRGPWKGVPMNSVRLATIWANKERWHPTQPHNGEQG